MSSYRRFRLSGGTYFFTVNCKARGDNSLLTDNIGALQRAVRHVKQAYPLTMNAFVIGPEHLHCIWTLPENETDNGIRWRRIKSEFSRQLPLLEHIPPNNQKRRERCIWQPRFWEHLITDERDFFTHLDYIHWNPVKHAWCDRVRDWPHSSFHHYVNKGYYPIDWGDAQDDGEYGE